MSDVERLPLQLFPRQLPDKIIETNETESSEDEDVERAEIEKHVEKISIVRNDTTQCLEQQANKMLTTSSHAFDVAEIGMTVSDKEIFIHLTLRTSFQVRISIPEVDRGRGDLRK